MGWPCNLESIEKLNKRFGTTVELRNSTIEEAKLPDENYDRAFSISVIEHLSAAAAKRVMQHVHRCLKPGCCFILTIDLFLNLFPFSLRQENEYGTNHNVRSLIDDSKWDMVVGDRKCLYGFPEFSVEFVLGNLEKFMIGYYPALTQCLVLKKK